MAKPLLGGRKAGKRPRPKNARDFKSKARQTPPHRSASRPERKPLERGESGRRGAFRFAGRAWHADRKPPGLSGWQAGRLKAHSTMWGGDLGVHGGISGGFASMIAAASGSKLRKEAA